jgi:hypothetical protein
MAWCLVKAQGQLYLYLIHYLETLTDFQSTEFFVTDVFDAKVLSSLWTGIAQWIGLVTGRELDSVIRFPADSPHPDRLWGPPCLMFSGNRVLLLLIKGAGRETDHSPTSDGEVGNAWSYSSTAPTFSWSDAYINTGATPSFEYLVVDVTSCPFQPLITFSPSMFEMEWSGDGEGTDYSTTSSPPRHPGEPRSEGTRGPAAGTGADMDSLSEELEDDLVSDDFSLPDSDDDEDEDNRLDSNTPLNRYSVSILGRAVLCALQEQETTWRGRRGKLSLTVFLVRVISISDTKNWYTLSRWTVSAGFWASSIRQLNPLAYFDGCETSAYSGHVVIFNGCAVSPDENWNNLFIRRERQGICTRGDLW